MLMQSFKSAVELDIPEPHRQALMKTLVLMETGKMRHVDLDRRLDLRKLKFAGRLFNMSVWDMSTWGSKCGSVCCIGGTAEAIGKVRFEDVNNYAELSELFNPTLLRIEVITLEQAAMALRNYLTTGKARWKEVIKNAKETSSSFDVWTYHPGHT